ncbi:MAG: CRISPR system precrRNA processing endoribonuclease RAMP protein Cas6, partial [Tomitella sp.]|nr:CRISPR system precrRNA processing endoribonuclease RAMP protein Cas6 [Tomitella sp.]
IVRSAMDRWDHHAPDAFTIPTDARADLLATVFLADMDGRTVRGAVGARTDQTGYLGTVVLALTRRATDPTAALFGAMLRFADIAGVGAQTTHGFGAVTLLSGPGTDQHRTTLNRRGPRNASSQFTPLPDLKVTPSTPDRRR